MTREETIIKISDVSYSYGNTLVVSNVNMEVKETDYFGLIGPNGGGKTTLLKLILGLLAPDKGTIEVFGRKPKQGRKFIGYVPQVTSFDLDFPISVIEVVLMGRLSKRGLLKRYTANDSEIALDSLEKVGLGNYKNRQIAKLSGGQMQRVLLARALASEPRLLLLDEPFSNIDTDWQGTFYGLLQELNKKIGVVLVSHDISALSNYVNGVACINQTLLHYPSVKEGADRIKDIYSCHGNELTHNTLHREAKKDV